MSEKTAAVQFVEVDVKLNFEYREGEDLIKVRDQVIEQLARDLNIGLQTGAR